MCNVSNFNTMRMSVAAARIIALGLQPCNGSRPDSCV